MIALCPNHFLSNSALIAAGAQAHVGDALDKLTVVLHAYDCCF